MRFLLLFALTAALTAAQTNPEALFHQDFETGAPAWSVVGNGGSVRVTRDPGAAHSGQGALAFHYQVKPRQIAAAVMPAPAKFARMQRIRFWLKTDRDAPMAVLLGERKPGGGNYTATFWSPKGEWHPIDLMPSDFVLSEGPNDPKDSDNQLDLDQVEAIGILDLGAFFAGAPGGAQLGLDAAGDHTLWIDDFEVLAGGGPTEPAGVIDAFDRGFLQWIPPARSDAKITAANPLSQPGVEIRYAGDSERVPLLTRTLGNFHLANATHVFFDVASEQPATIAVSLELKQPGGAQGPRFNLPIYPPGNKEVFHVQLKLADFQGQGTFDPAQLKSILFLDASAAGGGDLGKNTIWIGLLKIF